MPILTPSFTHVHHGDFPFVAGAGTLPIDHTLLIVHIVSNDYTSYSFIQNKINGIPFTIDSNSNSFNGVNNPSMRLYVQSYINDTGSAIDLTDAITIEYTATNGPMAVVLRAFTVDAVMVHAGSQTWSSGTSGSPDITGHSSTIDRIDLAAVGAYEEPASWSWVNGTSNYQNTHAVIGDGVATGSTAEVALGVFDYVGVPDEGGGITTLSLTGSVADARVVSALVSYKELIIKYGTIGTMPMFIQLTARPSLLPPPALIIDQQFTQPYYLSLLEAEFTQPYSQTIERFWAQTYGSLLPVENEVLDAQYKLGFDDVAAQLNQPYSLQIEFSLGQPYSSLSFVSQELATSYKLGFDDVATQVVQPYAGLIESELNQPYTHLQPVAKELNIPYKLGFDEVSGQLIQPYTLMVEVEFTQPYVSLITTAAELTQPYGTSISVASELESIYELVANDFVQASFTSHYTMYSSDNVVVINTSSGLTYKSGYTALPGE